MSNKEFESLKELVEKYPELAHKYMMSMNPQSSKKIKVFAYCDSPTCATGFGTVSRNIFEALQRTGRYEINIFGINYWGDPHPFPYRIYPAGTNPEKDPYGRQKAVNMIPKMDFDILFFLQDTFIMNFLSVLMPHLKMNLQKPFSSICYFPVDSILKQEWANNIDHIDNIVAYAEFGRQEVVKCLPQRVDDISVIPHGVNIREYHPIEGEELDIFKRHYFKHHADKFIVTNLNRNQQRKDIPRTIFAFKKFKERCPDSILYLHMAKKDQGWDLVEVCNHAGLVVNDDVVFPENFGPNQGYPRHIVNALYNCSDVVISTTLGEGFGLCLDSQTNVYTEDGIKTISSLSINDKVLSSNGAYNDVECIMSRQHDGDIYEITTWLSNIPVRSSPEHGFKVLTVDGEVWRKASELKVGDNLLFPSSYNRNSLSELNVLELISNKLNQRQLSNIVVENDMFKIQSNFKQEENLVPINIELSSDFCRIIGFYLAEGSMSSTKKDSVLFSFNKNEEDHLNFIIQFMKRVFNLDVYDMPDKREDYNGKTIVFYSSVVANLFDALCGHGARSKKLHSILLGLDEKCLIEILRGLYIGDGSYCKTNYEVNFSTTSKDIAYSVRLLLARLNILSSIRTSRVEYKVSVTGTSRERLFKLFNIECGVVDRSKSYERASLCDSYLVLPIKSIEKSNYIGKLIDIQVSNTNDFVAENVIVHNSWIESMATKTPVIMPGNTAMSEFISDDRGYLVKSGTDANLWTMLTLDNEIYRPLVDVNDLVEKMVHVYNNRDEAKQKAESAYKWVTTEMDWQGPIANSWVGLFDAIADQLSTGKYERDDEDDFTVKSISSEEV